jgi:hypothetical protein
MLARARALRIRFVLGARSRRDPEGPVPVKRFVGLCLVESPRVVVAPGHGDPAQLAQV